VPKITSYLRHQKGTTRLGTGSRALTRDGTMTSRDCPCRYSRGTSVRIDTEEVTGSIPVSPIIRDGCCVGRGEHQLAGEAGHRG